MRDIARRVGQTVPSLYYHYDSKEGAFVAILELGATELAWRVKAAADAGADPRQQFVNVVETIVLHMAHRTRLAALDPELRRLSPENRKRYAAHRKQIGTLLTEIIGTGVREGTFTAADPTERDGTGTAGHVPVHRTLVPARWTARTAGAGSTLYRYCARHRVCPAPSSRPYHTKAPVKAAAI